METGDYSRASYQDRKRKSPEDGSSRFPLDQLNDDVLEHVLSWLPASDILQFSSVCKRWKSVAASATFQLACSQIPFRDPWFFMVGSDQSNFDGPPIVFDSSENNWKKINYPLFLQQKSGSIWVPVAASGGLLCFQNAEESELVVCNPVTGACRQLVCPNAQLEICKNVNAIAMISGPDYYRIVLLSGETSDLSYTVYNSKTNEWEAEIKLSRKIQEADESIPNQDDNPMYFLSKCGNVVVSTDIQRNPCKQYSSVTTRKNGEEIVHFLSSSGSIVTCNLTKKCSYEFPRLLPLNFEYSFDLVKFKEEVYLVVLQEFLESASLRVWKYDETAKSWHQVAAMPPAMSHEFFGKRVDINCSGTGEQIMICLNSVVVEEDVCCYFLSSLFASLRKLKHSCGDSLPVGASLLRRRISNGICSIWTTKRLLHIIIPASWICATSCSIDPWPTTNCSLCCSGLSGWDGIV